MNKGAAPAPYEKVGFGGMKIEPVIIDENGGATKQVQELRNLYQRDNVDAVLGYIGSGDCLAVAPIAEELKKMLVLMDCGTPRIFEEAKYNYVFRTAAHATMDNVGAHPLHEGATTSRWTRCRRSTRITPGARTAGPTSSPPPGNFIPTPSLRPTCCRNSAPASTAPKSPRWSAPAPTSSIRACGAAICRPSSCRPSPRGLPKRSQLVFSAADHVLPPLGDKMPDGTIIGARGAYGLMSQKSPLNDWLFKGYEAANGVYPVQAAYRMTQSILGLKAAVEKAMAKNGGKKPSTDELVAAMTGLEWQSPGGLIQMKLADGHQAIQPIAFSRTKYNPDPKRVDLVDIQYFAGRMRQSAAGRQVARLDQGRHAGRQVQLSGRPLPETMLRRRDAPRFAPLISCSANDQHETIAMNFFLTIVLDGLIQASWLFIVALGLTLVFGVLKILNIAHGSFYALGAYIAATAVTMVAAHGLPPASASSPCCSRSR